MRQRTDAMRATAQAACIRTAFLIIVQDRTPPNEEKANEQIRELFQATNVVFCLAADRFCGRMRG